MKSVIVLGGYGVFGSRIVRSLARHPELDVVIAGRDAGAAQALAESLRPARVRSLRVDVSDSADVAMLLALMPAVVVDTVGPFQGRDRSRAGPAPYVSAQRSRSDAIGLARCGGANPVRFISPRAPRWRRPCSGPRISRVC